jgi:TatD DNase family protein
MLLDAHNHAHDARLAPWLSEIERDVRDAGIGWRMVNGTREEDWDAVETFTRSQPFALASFGLHPWHVPAASPRWRDRLLEKLAANPQSGVGEIGLDRWIKDYDLPAQMAAFRWQLEIAARENRPASIHCIQAWGAMLETLQEVALPSRGFLLHAYGGPAEMVEAFVRLGAYFSFSGYFLHERKLAQRTVFSSIPSDRLLVETDAPDLAPPAEANSRTLRSPDGQILNHPAYLGIAFEGLAKIRQCELADLKAQVEENYVRLYGPLALAA